MVKAIKQVDVVISALGRTQILDQVNIIDAIKEAGNVKVRFSTYIFELTGGCGLRIYVSRSEPCNISFVRMSLNLVTFRQFFFEVELNDTWL